MQVVVQPAPAVQQVVHTCMPFGPIKVCVVQLANAIGADIANAAAIIASLILFIISLIFCVF